MTAMDLHPLNHVRHTVPFVESLGIRVRFINDEDVRGHQKWRDIAPSHWVYLVPPHTVCVRRAGLADVVLSDAIHIVHEALHLVCGPVSLNDEPGVMAAEAWVIRSHAKGLVRNVMRHDFAAYGFDWTHPRDDLSFTEIGSCNGVWGSEEWLGTIEWAIAEGILNPDGSLALRGPHPKWNAVYGHELRDVTSEARS